MLENCLPHRISMDLVHVRNDSSQSRRHCHLHSNRRFFFSSRLGLPCIFSTYLEISISILDKSLKIPAEFVPKVVVQINERSKCDSCDYWFHAKCLDMSSNDYSELFDSCISWNCSYCKPENDIFLLGDFIIDYSKQRNQIRRLLEQFASQFGLSQIIKEFTSVTENPRSLIDLLFGNSTHRIVQSGVLQLNLSDHFLVYCVVKSGIPKSPPKIIDYRSFKTLDQNKFTKDLNQIPWSVLDSFDNIDDAVSARNYLLTEVHAPIKSRGVKGTPYPWMNQDILSTMHTRDFHHRIAIKSSSPNHWKMCKDLRKKVNRDTSKAKSTYFTQLIEQAKGNSKEMWSHLKKIFPLKSNDKSSGPDIVRRDGVSITELKAKANCLNEFFISIGRTLAARFNSTVPCFSPKRSSTCTSIFQLQNIHQDCSKSTFTS